LHFCLSIRHFFNIFVINIPNYAGKITKNRAEMTTFAKENCENRLHLSKKQALCVRFALFLSDDLIRFSMIDQIIDYNKDFVARKGYEDIVVRGFIIDSETGALEEIN